MANLSTFEKYLVQMTLLVLFCSAAIPQNTNIVLPRLRIMEFRAGSVASEMSCTIVYLDGHFYSEQETHSMGEWRQASVSAGELTPTEIQQMNALLEAKDFSALTSPVQEKRLVQEDQHLLQISVPRASVLQDLIYETDRARKPAQRALEPVLDWWKRLKAQHPPTRRTEKITQCQGSPR